MKIGFVIMTEFFKYEQIYALLKLVKAAQTKGHSIAGIFFFGTGVLNLKKEIHIGKDNRNIPADLAELAKQGIPLQACQTWADNFGLMNSDIVEGAEITGLGELSEITARADKLVVFGSHS